MSLRDLLKSERLKIRLAATEAKAGGMSRLGGLRGGLLGNLGSRVLAPRGVEAGVPPMQGQPEPPMANFQPKTPILGLFMQGSRPVRETISSLILSTQQQLPIQENPGLNPELQEPEIGACPMCQAQVLETWEFCPSCSFTLKASTGQESKDLSVQIDR